MVVTKNGKKYYTRNELDNRLNTFIEKSADELIIQLKNRKNKATKVKSKEIAYV